jgi:predicted transcriptional regulator
MQRISVHISDETKQRIGLAARAKNQVESELVRRAIDAGLDIVSPRFNSAKELVNLAKMAKKLRSRAKEPTDVSKDTAKYAFGK